MKLKSQLETPTSAALAASQSAAGPTLEPMRLLLDAARRIASRIETELDTVGLSTAKFQALDALVMGGRPMSLSDLAGNLECVRSNVTQLVDRLEADGLVKRVADPADRRAVYAVVTAGGRKRHTAGAAAIRTLQSELAARVDPADRAVFHRVLAALK